MLQLLCLEKTTASNIKNFKPYGKIIVGQPHIGGTSLPTDIIRRLELLSAICGKLSNLERKKAHVQTQDWSFHALLSRRIIP